ncbi:MAG: GNAT family N-acetyltransferase [Desulfobacteraceae bacterium]
MHKNTNIEMNNAPEIQIRFSSTTDSIFIRDLSAKAFKPFGEYGDIVLKWHLSGYSITVIACHEDQSLGFAMVSKPFSRYDQNNSSELLAIAIESGWQGKGIGKLLLREIEKAAFKTGILAMFLHTAIENRNARKLFSDSGYRIWQIKKDFYPEGQDACVMAKKITPV